ncbi:hypothetical protein EVAR_65783_1 [Eumeta japonica]|uniref:Uncharacterized protein n=1 Tax=Eumeta variegata TaxID=151549 RepID=A0A4C2A1H3_EUMVA|nr:hypothetical protein EVAR_65783_1 [Eumeta japonica]
MQKSFPPYVHTCRRGAFRCVRGKFYLRPRCPTAKRDGEYVTTVRAKATCEPPLLQTYRGGQMFDVIVLCGYLIEHAHTEPSKLISDPVQSTNM